MTDYISSEGANAAAGEVADYSGNAFNLLIGGLFDAYYITRAATASDYGWANLTGNSITLYGSEGSDQVNVNVGLGASYGGAANSNSNNWYLDLGDGADGGGVHTSASANGADAVANIYNDSASVTGGAGDDTLFVSQNHSALEGGWLSVEQTSRSVEGGAGHDRIDAGVTAESGAAASVNWSHNSLYASAGADGADILADNSFTAVVGGGITAAGNSFTLVGGETGQTVINGVLDILAGTAESAGGVVIWTDNSFYASAGAEGGEIYAQNFLTASWDGFISFSSNNFTLVGQEGADSLSVGVGFMGGSTQEGIGAGSGEVLNNFFSADGGSGDDVLDLFLNGSAASGGSVSLGGNEFYASGGEGNDTINLFWSAFMDGGVAELPGNTASLDGGAGSDTFQAYLGEGTSGSSVAIFGGDGNDVIETIDLGQNNERLISGGAGDDTITDDGGFSTVVFDGVRADYTIASAPGGWVSVTDNRDGSPDGSDLLYQVDQLQFSDGDILVADLALPIVGTDGDDTLFATDRGDTVYGYGGNDVLWGDVGNDTLDGGSGNDTLIGLDGNDTLLGGDGNDQLIGNRGTDQLSGGAGADKFSFGALFQSTPEAPDLITDFSGQTVLTINAQGHVTRMPGQGDKIDLSALDANTNVAGDQAFTLVQHGFSGHAGEVYSNYDAGTGLTSVFLDVNGDAQTDMTIQLLGQVKLTGADFIL